MHTPRWHYDDWLSFFSRGLAGSPCISHGYPASMGGVVPHAAWRDHQSHCPWSVIFRSVNPKAPSMGLDCYGSCISSSYFTTVPPYSALATRSGRGTLPSPAAGGMKCLWPDFFKGDPHPLITLIRIYKSCFWKPFFRNKDQKAWDKEKS